MPQPLITPAQGTQLQPCFLFFRNQKIRGRNKPEKQTPEDQDLAEAETRDDNNLNILRQTLLSEKENLVQVEIKLKEKDVSLVFPELQESET